MLGEFDLDSAGKPKFKPTITRNFFRQRGFERDVSSARPAAAETQHPRDAGGDSTSRLPLIFLRRCTCPFCQGTASAVP